LCVYNMRLGEKENLEEECCWGLKIAIFQQKKKRMLRFCLSKENEENKIVY